MPNVERKEPYETQAYAFMVLDGAQGSGRRSARRHRGFRRLPLTGKPAVRPDGDWYPPSGIPAPSIADIRFAATLEFLRAIDYDFPAWAEQYMTAMETTLGDAYSEPAADVRGYIDHVRSQQA